MKSLGIDPAALLAAAPAALRDTVKGDAAPDRREMPRPLTPIGFRLPGEEGFDASEKLAGGFPIDESAEWAESGERLAGVPAQGYSEEVVIQQLAPVFRVRDNALELEGKAEEFWAPLLTERASLLKDILPSVGRVEARLGGNAYIALGTAWVTSDGLLVTNRHVARFFAQHGHDGLVFRQAIPGPTPMDCRIDFSDQPNDADGIRIPADGIVFLSKDDRPDIALMRLSEDMRARFRPLGLRTEALLKDDRVAAIGFPEHDERARTEDIRRVFGDVFGCKRFAPGFVKSVAEDMIVHLCSTLGGNSGSPIIELGSGEVAGIHFGGFFDRENYAEPASAIRAIVAELTREGARPAVTAPSNSGGTAMSGNSITVTVPVTITVEIGQPVGGTPQVSTVNVSPAPAPAAGSTLDEAVAAARSAFGGYGNVVHIRRGWKFRDGWITDEPAVVIAVREKKELDELAATGATALPAQIGGFPVDITPASPFDLVPELRGDLLTEASIRRGTYRRDPAAFPLDPAARKMTGQIHVGPDAGSQMLVEFLRETEKRLAVGMYEFTAPHIVRAVKEKFADTGDMKMVLQKGEDIGGTGAKKDDQPDEQTVAELEGLMGARFANQWASVGAGRIFPWAYHIKVAVRDGKAFWLSSGSWQSSNQPDSNRRLPASADTPPFLLDEHNREWHVVLQDEGISKQLEKHILQDAEDARTELEAAAPEDPVIWIDSLAELTTAEEAPAARRYFEPYAISGKIRVRPILTPDNYPALVLDMIRSATKSILFQNQSFNIAAGRDARFTALLDAMKAKQRELEDVRIIIRGEFAREQIEKMKDYGFDVSSDKVRLQDRCHAKTFIVDDRLVLIGSHNFTDSGTTANRDASLLFDDPALAAYCREIYEYDWGRSRAAIREPRRGARLRTEEAVLAGGLVPVRLSQLGLL